MKNKLNEIREKAITQIKASKQLSDLNEPRINFLGKKG